MQITRNLVGLAVASALFATTHSADCQVLDITPVNGTVSEGEPVELEFRLYNEAPKNISTMWFSEEDYKATAAFRFRILDSEGNEVRASYHSFRRRLGNVESIPELASRFVVLKTGESLSFMRTIVMCDESGKTLPPGKYEIQSTMRYLRSANEIGASTVVEIASGKVDEQVASVHRGPSLRYFFEGAGASAYPVAREILNPIHDFIASGSDHQIRYQIVTRYLESFVQWSSVATSARHAQPNLRDPIGLLDWYAESYPESSSLEGVLIKAVNEAWPNAVGADPMSRWLSWLEQNSVTGYQDEAAVRHATLDLSIRLYQVMKALGDKNLSEENFQSLHGEFKRLSTELEAARIQARQSLVN